MLFFVAAADAFKPVCKVLHKNKKNCNNNGSSIKNKRNFYKTVFVVLLAENHITRENPYKYLKGKCVVIVIYNNKKFKGSV